MKRRNFNLLTASSAAALSAGFGLPKQARAAQAELLKTTLTPMGSNPAGNADGSIPPWTGGYTEIPAGWTPDQPMPDMFSADTPILKIDSSNMAQYQDRLADGVGVMMQKFGYSINVYKTRRTAAFPQAVYDNIYNNAQTAQIAAGGARLGFSGAFGGFPFPIPDTSDPNVAGAQIVWNHLTNWRGYHFDYDPATYSMENGTLTNVNTSRLVINYDYYTATSLANYDGLYYRGWEYGYAPPSNAGSVVILRLPTNPSVQPEQAWEVLNGQGRVRKVPELQYDIPSATADGITNYDEVYNFFGAPDEYDWKLVEQKELYIPYNNNKSDYMQISDYLPHFINPDVTRWELHRVWVVDATLHPGRRNVTARRRLYIDEDTWAAVMVDEYDGQGNYWKFCQAFMNCKPNLPGTVMFSTVVYNIQAGSYLHEPGFDVTLPSSKRVVNYLSVPADNLFNPQAAAAAASY